MCDCDAREQRYPFADAFGDAAPGASGSRDGGPAGERAGAALGRRRLRAAGAGLAYRGRPDSHLQREGDRRGSAPH